MTAKSLALSIIGSLVATLAHGTETTKAETSQGVWAMGITTRLSDYPYKDEDLRVDFQPDINYQGTHWYIEGTEAGWRSSNYDGFYVQALSRFRYGGYSVENSDALDGMRRYGTLEAGAKVGAETAFGDITFQATHDTLNRHQGWSSTLEWRGQWLAEQWRIEPFAALDYDSAEVNNYYFGVKPLEAMDDRSAYSAGDAVNYRFGIDSWYRLGGPHLLGASIAHTLYDSSVKDSPITDGNNGTEVKLSYRYEFINNPAAQAVAKASEAAWLKGDWEWRAAAGYHTDENFIEMIYLTKMGINKNDTAIASGFLSKKITERTFDLPIQMHVTGGIARHFERNLQSDFNEYVFAIKGYFNQFPWSHKVETRVGFGYGFSYAEQVPRQESDNVLKKNIGDTRTNQYLDYSWDVNIGDLFNAPSTKHCYAGYSIHHRSGIFSKSELYNNVDGGSNWNTFYIQCKVKN